MDTAQRFVWNKLITGGFRVGVSQKLVTRALARFGGIDEAVIAHRLMGNWEPNKEYFAQILSPNTEDADISRLYPFYLAYALDEEIQKLGDVRQWQAAWSRVECRQSDYTYLYRFSKAGSRRLQNVQKPQTQQTSRKSQQSSSFSRR